MHRRIRRILTSPWLRRLGIPVLVVSVFALAAPTLLVHGNPPAPAQTLVPIGGGYSEASLEGFARVVIQHASGTTVSILVVPAAYGDTQMQHQKNVAQATERTQEIQDACDAVVDTTQFPGGCSATLLQIFTNADAANPAYVAAFNNLASGGCFLLGGDQDIAMEVLAGTPVESAMASAYTRGVVFSGTSAGAAVQAANMNAGDSATGGPTTGLQHSSIIMWWADNSNLQRGLVFGSQRAIFDQHVDQRGRFGRMFTAAALSADHYGGGGLLSIGSDFQTGVTVGNDGSISNIFGDTAGIVVDFQTAHATYSWSGPSAWLSSRSVLTHLLAPNSTLSYSLTTRTPTYNGKAVKYVAQPAWSASLLRAPGSGGLILGGDVSADPSGPALTAFVNQAKASGRSQIVVVAAGYASTSAGQQATNTYTQALNKAGWQGQPYSTLPLTYGASSLDPHLLDSAAGVLFVGGDQSFLAAPLGDASFRAFVAQAVASAPVVMTDHAMTAAAGDWYDAIPEPTSANVQDIAIAAFHADNASVQPGLGLLHGVAFEPRLTADQRWGRLYGLSMAYPSTIVFGIGENSAIICSSNGAQDVGAGPVMAIDGRGATYYTGDNGAIGAFDVVAATYAPGDAITAG
jgi:cyanophycinase-like exopeptidase